MEQTPASSAPTEISPGPLQQPQPQPQVQPLPEKRGGGNRSLLTTFMAVGIVILVGGIIFGVVLARGRNKSTSAPLPKIAAPTASPTVPPTISPTTTPVSTKANENPFEATPTPVTNPFEQTVTNPFEGL